MRLSVSTWGEIILHGPHQEAVKYITTSRGPAEENAEEKSASFVHTYSVSGMTNGNVQQDQKGRQEVELISSYLHCHDS